MFLGKDGYKIRTFLHLSLSLSSLVSFFFLVLAPSQLAKFGGPDRSPGRGPGRLLLLLFVLATSHMEEDAALCVAMYRRRTRGALLISRLRILGVFSVLSFSPPCDTDPA